MCFKLGCGFFGVGVGRIPHPMPFPNGGCCRCDDDQRCCR